MAKPDTKGARVLDDKATNPATGTIPQVAAAEAKPARKKNQNITVAYIDKDGKDQKTMTDGALGVHVIVPEQVDYKVLIKDLHPAIQTAALLFGLNTVYRNQFNTRLNADGADMDDAVEALINRHKNFEAGIWRPEGDGSDGGVPLVIEAIKRAYLKIGKTEAEAEAAATAALAKYRDLDKDGKASQIKAWMKRGKVEVAFAEIKAERAAERLKKTRASVSADTDDLTDL